MSRTFLPKLRPGKGIALPETYTNTFVAGGNDLLRQVHENMEVGSAQTEARAPSPFSRVWQFQRSLKGEVGPQEKARAVAAFRGILALFALRDFYHVKVEADVTAQLVAGSQEPTPIEPLFDVHTQCLPQSNNVAEARFLFGKRIVTFNLLEPSGAAPTVIAGYSPLTLIFPAARSLESSGALGAIFWYDKAGKRWHDPTADTDRTRGRLTQEARQQLALWLDEALRHPGPNGQGLAILASDRLSSEAVRLVMELLAAWRSELKVPPADGTGGVRHESLVKSVVLQTVETNEAQTFAVPPLLESVYAGLSQRTDFFFRSGSIYVTLEESQSPNHRIYLNVFGSAQVHGKLETAPAEGSDLGTALGRPGEAPVPYVILDKLFTAKLARVQEGPNTVCAEWAALSLLNGSPELNGIYLLPFTPAVLRYFSPNEIREGVTGDNNVGAAQVSFRPAGSRLVVRKTYGMEDIYKRGNAKIGIDPSLDLRFFPKFRLDSVADVLRQLPLESDRFYHARARLSPDLDKEKLSWLGPDGATLSATARYEGDYVKPDRKTLALGRQAFWRLPMETTPTAFQIEGLGLILLVLEDLGHHQQSPTPWTAGLDFGTTNSCVAIDRGGGGTVQRAEKLPVLTTTFLRTWSSALRGDSDEGPSALADFFFWENAETTVLNDLEFFPTQILTRLSLREHTLPHRGFNPLNGLAFFPNVSLAAIKNQGFTDLIEHFGRFGGTQVKPRFNLNRDLKWKAEEGDRRSSQIWREVFHRHLRLQLVLTAAHEKGYIAHLVASYPKAFLPEEVSNYRKMLVEVWSEDGPTVELRSESAAASMSLEITLHHEYFLVDIGGGTTDVAVFKDRVIQEECSFKLAGGEMEQYVVVSSRLRRALADAFEVETTLAEAFVKEGELPEFYKTVFQGLLVEHGAEALSRLRQRAASDKATHGFFLASLLLYAGISFFCGLWLKKRRSVAGGAPAAEHLQWLGNGSSFIRMLTIGDKSIESVLIRMFNLASSGSAQALPLREDAKTLVAKGLLKEGLVAGGDGQHVFSSLLSDSIVSDNHEWAEIESLSKFYQALNFDRTIEWNGLAEGKIFRRFLEALQGELPAGNFNRSPLIKLAAVGAQDPTNWAVQFVEAHKGSIATKVCTRLKVNKARWGGALQTAETLYVEPVFISELAAVLWQVRETCA